MATLREARPECCGGHRERCLFGRPHVWVVWYENGRLKRTPDTLHCGDCGGVCTAAEEPVKLGPTVIKAALLRRRAVPEGVRLTVRRDGDGWRITVPEATSRHSMGSAERVAGLLTFELARPVTVTGPERPGQDRYGRSAVYRVTPA